MTSIPLAETGRGVADASGRCVLFLGPQRPGHKWQINRYNVNTSSALDTTFTIYNGSISVANIIDSSANGNGDVDPSAAITLQTLDRLVAVWDGATPGASCFMSVYGTVEFR